MLLGFSAISSMNISVNPGLFHSFYHKCNNLHDPAE